MVKGLVKSKDTGYYSNQIEQKRITVAKLSNLDRSLSIIRGAIFLVILLLFYYYIKTESSTLIWFGVTLVFGFFALIKYHGVINIKLLFERNLLKINQDEINYLEQDIINFPNGDVYKNEKHPYAADLDLFGDFSLYQNICRSTTFYGKSILAQWFLNKLDNDAIIENQNAIKDLSDKIEWRQNFVATGMMNLDKEEEYIHLEKWMGTPVENVSSIIKIISYLLPLCFILASGFCLITRSLTYVSYVNALFFLNLAIAASYLNKIKNVIQYSTNLSATLEKNALLFHLIENQAFTSNKLNTLKISISGEPISKSLKNLSQIFAKLDSGLNPMSAILFNGSLLYHVHAYLQLQNWKEKNAKHVISWLKIAGEYDALNSLANLHYNNADFTFPSLNNEYIVEMKDVGHPLINNKKRVCNDISFSDQRFVILTGSNMSGKSTFLRSLGVNMVLGGMGSAIASSKANIHPLNIYVSMRQSDNLHDGESYFYAEVKRLQHIMDSSLHQINFILLDEILRGTNSDDKRYGTLGVIEKIVSLKCIGVIATHDLEVCTITDKYTEILTNKCFEGEINDDELTFDYKLREGICQNKNASFIMKKMGLIR